MKNKIIGWLLNQANRETKSEYFYAIKNKLLARYGKFVRYDIQFLEGKKCYTCGGSGIYVGYNYSGYQFSDTCNRCFRGWYKQPTWVILELLELGGYQFHQPKERVYKKPEVQIPIIEGYIEHTKGNYGELALTILFLIYEKGYLKRFNQQAGLGWRTYWWLPKNWLNNFMHLKRFGKESIPVSGFIRWWNESGYVKDVVYDYEFFVGRRNYEPGDELPF